MTTPSSTIPDDVTRVLGENAVHCDDCEGWHHVDYHKRRGTHLGPHDFMLLDRWGRQLYEAFNAMPYLVGSAERGEREWRDVDVRILLPEEAAWLGEIDGLTETAVSLRLRTVNLAISLWGRQVTGLPIDFQFQPDAEFHAHDGEPRGALGISLAQVVKEIWDRREAIHNAEHPDDEESA